MPMPAEGLKLEDATGEHGLLPVFDLLSSCIARYWGRYAAIGLRAKKILDPTRHTTRVRRNRFDRDASVLEVPAPAVSVSSAPIMVEYAAAATVAATLTLLPPPPPP